MNWKRLMQEHLMERDQGKRNKEVGKSWTSMEELVMRKTMIFQLLQFLVTRRVSLIKIMFKPINHRIGLAFKKIYTH